MPTQDNAAADTFPGGHARLRVQFETFVNSGQACTASAVTIAIAASGAPDQGSGTPVPVTSTGIASLGNGLFEYAWDVPTATVPGSYLVTWTGTRASDSVPVTYVQAVNVAAPPTSVPLPGVYASVAQYRAWSRDQVTPDAMIETALMRGTEQIDVALVAAVYATDADGMPTDPALANVLARATSAQAQYIIAANDDPGIKREYSSISAGGVTYTRAPGTTALALPPLAPQALAILRVSGIQPSAPLVNW